MKNELVEVLTSKRNIWVEWENERYEKKKFSLTNDIDVMMVLDTHGFIVQKDKENIYTYLKNQIANEELRKPYEELKKGICNIGDKIATFTLRDIGLMNPQLIQNLNLNSAGFEFVCDFDGHKLFRKRK
jgi:hypothetical protein